MTRPTVMVVDDEEELLEIFTMWLEMAGYRVLTAANGLEALKLVGTEKIDAVVSDIRMPIMDGPTLVRSLREMGLAIPVVVFVSGFGDIDLREMHALGVEATIEKPMARRELVDTLADSFKHRRDLWLAPVSTPAMKPVRVDLCGADRALRADQFELGRGGFCFPSNRVLAKGQMIDVMIRFPDGSRCLKASGEVRWYDRGTCLAGVAFQYLDPICRDWVISSILADAPRSFIPSGKQLFLPLEAANSQDRAQSQPCPL